MSHIWSKEDVLQSCQYKTYLKLCNRIISPTENGNTFLYLGKVFSFDMDMRTVKNDMMNDLEGYITKIDMLPIHPKLKIQILPSYVYSKLKFSYDCLQTRRYMD